VPLHYCGRRFGTQKRGAIATARDDCLEVAGGGVGVQSLSMRHWDRVDGRHLQPGPHNLAGILCSRSDCFVVRRSTAGSAVSGTFLLQKRRVRVDDVDHLLCGRQVELCGTSLLCGDRIACREATRVHVTRRVVV
jgi:hypothetical protein